ncbi:hypothetical protein [Anabaena catenula]|uniref:Uncharacterized protein n=1 Tax=Anabaena catenula FACHB-362 TaxID=2692877 RepID=A0ABR8IXG0_9NOST|nr:hypothetical protein [Anabaena catenula FACHB-362]
MTSVTAMSVVRGKKTILKPKFGHSMVEKGGSFATFNNICHQWHMRKSSGLAILLQIEVLFTANC